MANQVSDKSLVAGARARLKNADNEAARWGRERRWCSESLVALLCCFRVGDVVDDGKDTDTLTVKRVEFWDNTEETAENPEFLLSLVYNCPGGHGHMTSRNGTNDRLQQLLMKVEK